ncbi:hypothetical protein R3P38DRAFT_2786901 [Favolaschia claudopus]|uniref:Uncharacterized protein n=1 Tax=Favolaschia claudopus TaxID=2862362 RepID=A0AAW0AQY3_9AGAR
MNNPLGASILSYYRYAEPQIFELTNYQKTRGYYYEIGFLNVLWRFKFKVIGSSKAHITDTGSKHWTSVSLHRTQRTNYLNELDEIREDADGDPKGLVRYGLHCYHSFLGSRILSGFRHVLEQDQKKHGKKDYKDSDIQDVVDHFQQKVDDIIDVNAATSADDHAEPDAEPSDHSDGYLE